MPKVKISEFSSTPGNNTDIDGINIAENCAPSGINDAIRELMAQLKDWQAGTSNDPYVVGSSGSLTLSYGTANGVPYLNGSKVLTTGSALTFDGTNLGFGGTGQRITGDFSNATVANRVMFQNSVTNGNTVLGAIPNGTGAASALILNSSSDPANSSTLITRVGSDTGVASILSAQTGTGSFLPMTFTTGGSERMRLDTSGNLGIGTSSPGSYYAKNLVVGVADQGGITIASSPSAVETYLMFADGTSGADAYTGYIGYSHTSNFMRFATNNGGERMRIDSSGNVGIGTSSPSSFGKLAVNGNIVTAADNTFIGLNDGTDNKLSLVKKAGGFPCIASASGAPIIFSQSSAASIVSASAETYTERARIDSSGNLLVGTTSTSGRLSVVGNAGGTCASFNANSNTVTPVGIIVGGNDTTQAALYVYSNGNGAFNAYIYSNGNLQNRNNSYGGISDVKLKENITEATPKLEKLQQVRVVNYNIKGDTQKQIGVIAQELEQVFPGMVEETPDRDQEGNDLGTTTKAVKYSVFVPMLIKAIQEQQAIIDAQQAALTALTARVTALETN